MPANARPTRDYDSIAARVEAARLRGQTREESLELGPHRDKPACTPIGLHGVCGQSFLSRRAMVIDDVRALGDNYVACDPRDRSEVVVPLLDPDGRAWGVLDLDSHETGAFADSDVAGLRRVLAAAFGETAVEVDD
jgi:L-methionine (R)-S-oxide reductase